MGFIEAPEWGLDGEAPYLSNLSRGNKGAYFKFDTVASEIDFYFGGEISVDSTYPEFSRVTGLNSSGEITRPMLERCNLAIIRTSLPTRSL